LAQYTRPIHLKRHDVRKIMHIEDFNNLIENFGVEKSRLDVSAMDGGAGGSLKCRSMLRSGSGAGF